jgi:DNA-binding NarL/FixJ family response regulator
MKRTTILLAEDYPPMCDAVRKLLEPAYEVIGCVGDGRTLLKTAIDLKPDLVLLDVGLPSLNGLEAARQLRKLLPQVKLVFLTMNTDPDIANEALRMGASGYVLKHSIPDELLPAIENAVTAIR